MQILSLVLTFFTFIASAILPFAYAPAPENTQDDFIPVVRFVATSDTHVQTLGDKACYRIAKMMKSAYAYSDADADYTNLDAVVFSGDLTDDGAFTSFASFTATTNYSVREGTQRLAVVAKSHDSSMYSANALDLYTAFTGQETDFHRVINGFHFIGISRSSDGDVHYTAEQIKWLDEQLAAAVAEDPSKPVFVFNHEHIADTVFGSYSQDGWGTKYFSEVLEKYPQVVDISGHSHYPANDPRSIWQGTFTAINDGGLAYYEFTVDGVNAIHPDNYRTMTQALIIEVDAQNRVLVKVLDVDAGQFVAEYLVDNIDAPVKEKYSFEYRKSLADAPVFDEDAKLSVKEKNGKFTVTVPQAKTNADNKVYLYRISVTDENNNEIYSAWELSQYYFADVPESISFDSFTPESGTYTVKVIAEDIWGNTSTPLYAQITR